MPDEPAPPPAKKRLPTTLIIVVVVMVVEAAGFFAVMKFFGGGPEHVVAAEGEHYVQGGDPTTQAATLEVPLPQKFKVLNTKSGRAYMYDFDLVLVVRGDRKAELDKLIETRGGEIADRVNMVIRSADPRELEADDLESLRLSFKRELSRIARDDSLIVRVLIPRAVQMRAD